MHNCHFLLLLEQYLLCIIVVGGPTIDVVGPAVDVGGFMIINNLIKESLWYTWL